MPRRPRLDAPGLVHHVIMRGIDRRIVFSDDDDRRDLVARLSRVLPESDVACLAWALLPNHVHLVIRSGRVPLSRWMARVATGHAVRFNKREARVGYVFQGRFKSRAAVDDADVLGLIRYVNTNPVKHGVVASVDALTSYPWSGHAALVAARAPWPFESLAAVRDVLGYEPRVDRARWEAWLAAPEADEAPSAPAAPGTPPLPPCTAEGGARCPEQVACDLVELVGRVCAARNVDLRVPRGRRASGAVAAARAEIARRAVLEHGMSASAVGRALGMSREGIRQALARAGGEARPRTDAGATGEDESQRREPPGDASVS